MASLYAAKTAAALSGKLAGGLTSSNTWVVPPAAARRGRHGRSRMALKRHLVTSSRSPSVQPVMSWEQAGAGSEECSAKGSGVQGSEGDGVGNCICRPTQL